MTVRIARCPEHGLHGERDECFVCEGPVERVEMIPADVAQAFLDIYRRSFSEGSVPGDEISDAENALARVLGEHVIERGI